MFTTQFNKIVKESKTSIYKISKDTDIPATTMYDWSKGNTSPSFDYVVKLSEYFDVPVSYFAE